MRLSSSNFRAAGPLRARRGAALAMALFAAFSVAAISLALLQLGAATTRRQAAAADRTRAFYLAEAALAEAYWGVMTGKTGQVGSGTDPAAYGDGLFWVDSDYALDGSVMLEATGMVGKARVRLGLAVRWTEESVASLGFFSGGDLVLQPGSLVDGYSSREGTYAQQAQVLEGLLSTRAGGRVGANGSVTVLSPASVPAGDGDPLEPWSTAMDPIQFDTAAFVSLGLQRQAASLESADLPSDWARELAQSLQATIRNFGDANAIQRGGTVLYGELSHGVDGQLTLEPGSHLEGQITTLTSPIQLPPVELPSIEPGGSLKHEDALPLVLSGPSVSYESIEVFDGAQLVIVGPTTLVVGSLVVVEGAEIVFDTRDGDIDLYVGEELNLESGSLVTFTEERPRGLEVLVAGVGDVLLQSADPFHGLVYAPSATVRLGADSEFFGALVAGGVELGTRARLHFDHGLADAQGDTALLLKGWEIIELGTIRGEADPFHALGVDRNTLRKPIDSHTDLWIEIRYTDAAGIELRYEGWESTFDWGSVVVLDRLRARLSPGGETIQRVRREGPWLESRL